MTTTGTTTSGEQESSFAPRYARLRTVLDGLELNALRYCLSSDDTATRVRRAEEIEAALMPLVREWQKFGIKAEESCSDGYVLCNGVCVPYNCVDLGNMARQTT
jgi:hypothetical protein